MFAAFALIVIVILLHIGSFHAFGDYLADMPNQGDSEQQQYIDKIQCITYTKCGKTPKWIANELGRSTQWVYKYRNIPVGDIDIQPQRSGRPPILTRRAKQAIRRYDNKWNASNRIVSNKIANIQSVSHQTVWRERKRVGLKPYLRQKIPFLTEKNIRDRQEFGRGFGRWNRTDWEKVLFTDELDLSLTEQHRHGREVCWSLDADSVPKIKSKQYPTIYKVHAGFSARGLLPIYWYGDGDYRLDAEFYVNSILDYQIDNVKRRRRICADPLKTRLFEDLDDWWYQQDGATAHTANLTQDYLSDAVPNFIYKTQWPGKNSMRKYK